MENESEDLNSLPRSRKAHLEFVRICEGVKRLDVKRGELIDKGFSYRKPSTGELEELYGHICTLLNSKYKLDRIRTKEEDWVHQTLMDATKLTVLRSFWVERNVDFFIPGIRGQTGKVRGASQGLVIEVNGSIHDQCFKMRKDDHVRDFLFTIGVPISTIENDDVYSSHTQKYLIRISNCKRLDTRGRQRLLRKIWSETIALHATNEGLNRLYGEDLFGWVSSRAKVKASPK